MIDRSDPTDPELPLADALEQDREAVPGDTGPAPSAPTANDADPADAWEQSLEVPLDEDDGPRD